MVEHNEPTSEAAKNVTGENVESRSQLLPEEVAVEGHPDPTRGELDPRAQAAAILAESEERTLHPDADDATGGHRRSEDTADLP